MRAAYDIRRLGRRYIWLLLLLVLRLTSQLIKSILVVPLVIARIIELCVVCIYRTT